MTTKTDIDVSKLVINTLSKAQYDAAKEAGEISDTELYLVTDEGKYITDAELAEFLAKKQDLLTAGENITIEGNVITAIDTTYTAGTNVTIDESNVISVEIPEYSAGENVTITDGVINVEVPKYTAGENVTIDENGVISAEGEAYTAGKNITIVDNVISATGANNAEEVAYNNGGYTNVQEALDALLYVEPNVTSFTGGGTYEIGTKISTINFAWAVNKEIVSQSINNGVGAIEPATERAITKNFDTPITTNTTFTLTVADDKGTQDTATTSLAFRYSRYWGVSAETQLDNDAILNQLSSELCTSRKQTKVFDCSGGKYFYLVIPTEYVNGIAFKVGGLSFSDMQISTMDVTNASGHKANYTIYRSGNIQTGSAINVEVV